MKKKILFFILNITNFVLTECPAGSSNVTCWQNSQCQPPIGTFNSICVQGKCVDKGNLLCILNS